MKTTTPRKLANPESLYMPYSVLSITLIGSPKISKPMSMSWIVFLKSVHDGVGIQVGTVEGKAALGLFHQKAERVNIQVLTPSIILRW